MEENKLKDQNILLVKDKDSDKLKAVAGIAKNGKLEMVEATAENANHFLKFDRNKEDELAKIIANFKKRASNSEEFELYQVRYGKFEKQKEGLEEVLSRPHNSQAKELLRQYQVNPKDFNQPKATILMVLLVQGEDGKMKAVSGVDEDGKLKTVNPTKGNADQFWKIDTNSNFLENFMKKFSAQFSHPAHTGVYAVSESSVDKVADFFNKIVSINHTDKVLDPYRVNPDGKIKEPEQGKYQPLNLNKVDWSVADKLGLSGEKMVDALKAMVYGHKSPALIETNSLISQDYPPQEARIQLKPDADGNISIVTHPKQEKPDFEKPFMGVVFTEQDKEQFRKNGNGGRVFELEVNGEKIPSLVSLDRLTNRFEAKPLSEISIPQTLKGTELSPKQQADLGEGKAVWIEGMDKRIKQGEQPQKIDRFVQFNAVNGNFDFKFSDEQRHQHKLNRQAKQNEGKEQKPGDERKVPKARKIGEVWVYSKQRGVQLDKESFDKLCAKEPIFVKNMERYKPKQQADASGAQKVEATDKKGQKYNAWVWVDDNIGKVRHTTDHPNQVRAIEAKRAAKDTQKVTPAAESKTQAAVNNEGKTNEATKHSTDPLKKGQTQPTEKQAEKKAEKQEQKQSPAVPKKRKGHKI